MTEIVIQRKQIDAFVDKVCDGMPISSYLRTFVCNEILLGRARLRGVPICVQGEIHAVNE